VAATHHSRMATKLVASFDYSDAELLALYRECAAKISQAQEYEILGEKYTRADLDQVLAAIAKLEARVNAANRVGPVRNLVRRNYTR